MPATAPLRRATLDLMGVCSSRSRRPAFIVGLFVRRPRPSARMFASFRRRPRRRRPDFVRASAAGRKRRPTSPLARQLQHRYRAHLALIEAGRSRRSAVEDLAARLGVGERQLRRLFRHHLGASPIAVAQTRRILLAKQLIHDTRLPMTEVAAGGRLRQHPAIQRDIPAASAGLPQHCRRRGTG